MKHYTLAAILLLIVALACVIPGAATPSPMEVPTFDANSLPTIIASTAQAAVSQTAVAIQSSVPSASPTLTITPTLTFTPDKIDDKGVSMRFIPAGTFMMGNDNGYPAEKPAHLVDLSDYYIDKYEVTNKLYKACEDAGACMSLYGLHTSESFTRPNYYGNPEFDNYPVVQLMWADAKAYCEWRGARLPTEAEWEKAARGTDERTYPWGEGIDCSLSNYGRGDLQSGGDCNSMIHDTTEVGSYETDKSPYGVYDMGGNVTEWTNDFFGETYYQSLVFSNPQGPIASSITPDPYYSEHPAEIPEWRVVRGGSWWKSGGLLVGSSLRKFDNANTSRPETGFRCASSQ